MRLDTFNFLNIRTWIWVIVLSLLYKVAKAQELDAPILKETPKRGIYKTFEEFKFNVPSITDSFYVHSKLREQNNWEGTLSFTPVYAENNKKVKDIWGFSDGRNAYAFHQSEFFKVQIDSGQVGFYAYRQWDDSGIAVAVLLGGVAGGVLFTGIAIDNAKRERVYYKINMNDGKLNSWVTSNFGGLEDPAELVIYRRGKKEKDAPFHISLNDSIQFVLMPNSIRELSVPISRKPVKICFGGDDSQCNDFIVVSKGRKYLEASMSKNNEIKLEPVDIEVGEFYSQKAKYFQDKREK